MVHLKLVFSSFMFKQTVECHLSMSNILSKGCLMDGDTDHLFYRRLYNLNLSCYSILWSVVVSTVNYRNNLTSNNRLFNQMDLLLQIEGSQQTGKWGKTRKNKVVKKSQGTFFISPKNQAGKVREPSFFYYDYCEIKKNVSIFHLKNVAIIISCSR